MQIKSPSIVLRTTAYGETSLISTQFVRETGIESFMHKGIRKSKTHQGNLLQSGQVLDLLIQRKPQNQWAYIREMSPHALWIDIPYHMVKSSLVLFLSEYFLRLLPPRAPMPELFDLHYRLLGIIEHTEASRLANLPLFLLRESSQMLGIGIQGKQSPKTPHLDFEEGGFTSEPGIHHPGWNEEMDLPFLSRVLQAPDWEALQALPSEGRQRHRILEGYIAYIRYHTEHMGPLRSLDILAQLWQDKKQTGR